MDCYTGQKLLSTLRTSANTAFWLDNCVLWRLLINCAKHNSLVSFARDYHKQQDCILYLQAAYIATLV